MYLPCRRRICYTRKLIAVPLSTPTLKLAILVLLDGDLSHGPGTVAKGHIRVVIPYVRYVRDKTASFCD